MSYQESWDNSGMQVGNRAADIKAVLLATDVTESVVSESISKGCNLIISHHPLIFRGLKHLTGSTPQERCVEMAIRHDIAIYSAHTSMDSVLCGVSGHMADILGLQEQEILVPSGTTSGSSCTSSSSSSSSSSGSSKTSDVYGLGVIGTLAQPISAAEFVTMVKERFGAQYVRFTAWNKPVQRVALCGGAGAEFCDNAIAAGADAYLTADVKYHEFCDANGRILLVDIDHWVSEHYTRDIYKVLLEKHVPCYISEADATPVFVL